MSEPIAYLKGQYVPASECVLPIYDLGIVLGASVTDFLRTFHQQAYRIEDHVQRFYRSCKYARITPPVPIAKTTSVIAASRRSTATYAARRNGLWNSWKGNPW